jgi:hypothetical protein
MASLEMRNYKFLVENLENKVENSPAPEGTLFMNFHHHLTAAAIVNGLAAALASFTADEAGAAFPRLAYQHISTSKTTGERTDPLRDE